MAGASHPDESAPESDGPPGSRTRALDVQSIGRAGALLAWTVAALSAAGAYVLATSGGRTALTGGVLLGVVALAALAVGVQATGEPWPGEPGYGEERTEAGEGEGLAGREARRSLLLPDRLALGLLGGALGGLAVTLVVWASEAAGAADLLGVRIAGELTPASLALRAWYGALWGVVLAALYPRLPGRSAISRGTLFGLLPAAYALLVLYPLVLELGWLAADLGALTFVLVIAYHLLWGAVAGALFRWGEVTDLGVLSRPLVGGGSGR